MSTIKQERGVCFAHAFDGSSYCLDRSEYERLLQVWKAGIAFFEGRGLHGEPLHIKLARIEAISEFSPQHYASYEADQREEKQQSMLNGDAP